MSTMTLGSPAGQASKQLELFSKKFYDGIGESNKKFRQMVSVREKFDMGMGNGDVFTISITGDLPIAGEIGETEETPVADFDIDKVSVQVKEFGQKIIYTEKYKRASGLPLEEIFRSKLGKNAAETLDKECHDRVFAVTNLVAWPTSATAVDFDETATVGTPNTSTNLTLDHVLKIVTKMEELRIPKRDGKYYCILTPKLAEPIKKELTTINQHTETGFLRFVQGVIGEIYGCVFVVQNNVVTKDAYFFGDHIGFEVVLKPEQIIVGNSYDLNRKRELGWTATLAFSPMMDNRIVRFDGRSA